VSRNAAKNVSQDNRSTLANSQKAAKQQRMSARIVILHRKTDSWQQAAKNVNPDSKRTLQIGSWPASSQECPSG